MAWCSPELPVLLSEESPLETGPITVQDASVISSLYYFGGALGAFIFGLLIDRIGRKYTLLLCGVLPTIAWGTILFGSNVMMLCISRVLAGIGAGGAYVAIPAFVAEISNTK